MPFLREITGHYHQRRKCILRISTCQKRKSGRIAVIGGNVKYASRLFVRYSRWWNWATPTLAMLYSRKRGEGNIVPAATIVPNSARNNEKKTGRLYLHRSCWLPGIDHQSRRALDNAVTISARSVLKTVLLSRLLEGLFAFFWRLNRTAGTSTRTPDYIRFENGAIIFQKNKENRISNAKRKNNTKN